MKLFRFSLYWQEKLACAYFFACPGIAYGIFTSRLPALKALTAANDAEIGFLLLAFGASSFSGLLVSRFLIDHAGARIITGCASLALSIFLVTASLALSYWQLLGFGMAAGLSMGLCDVSMNAQGIILEKKHHQRSISFLHASYSLGGVCGALSGSVFAAANLSPFMNFLLVQGFYLFLWPLAFGRLQDEKHASTKAGRNKTAVPLPVLIYIFGIMSMCSYVSEGSIGEWGSILLHSAKGASQELAALVFACFSTTMVIGRFLGDGIRAKFSDFVIVFTGSLIACAGMIVILISSSPVVCLCSYACMGAGCAPIVPILFSRAGNVPGVSPGRASSIISLLSYSGLLVFPPFIGMLAQGIGLDNALWIIVFAIFCILCGSFSLRKNCKTRQ